MKTIYLLLSFSLLLISCEEDEPTPQTPNTPTNSFYGIWNYTETGEATYQNGERVSQIVYSIGTPLPYNFSTDGNIYAGTSTSVAGTHDGGQHVLLSNGDYKVVQQTDVLMVVDRMPIPENGPAQTIIFKK